MKQISTIIQTLALILTVSSCGKSGEDATLKATTTEGATARATPVLREQFDGRIIPKNATKLRAPQNTFRVGGWVSDSSWIKLQDITEDGKEVQAGDVIGRFEFRGKEALPRVKESIQRAEADRDKAGLDIKSELDTMTSSQKQSALNAQRAKLDTMKEGVVSARDLERYDIAFQLADFEANAQSKQIKSYKRAVDADKAFQEQNVQLAMSDMERFKIYEKRFVVRAPHSGVVRHAYYARRRRKIQKGDGMPAGLHFASVARDQSLMLEIFIPEHRYALIRSKPSFLVKSPSSSQTYEVKVTKVFPFPQEIGYIKENNDLPDAREKIYVLQAEFVDSDYSELSAGLDVKVVIP